MHPHTASARTIKSGTAATMIGLVVAGMAGVTTGGPLWGFLGAALLLFCVGWICHLFQYDQGTREIERFYHLPIPVASPARMTTRAARSHRARPYVLTPLGELESVQ